MNQMLVLVLSFAFLIAAPVSAEYYKYYDENGNLRFTDDINQIPPDQRNQVKTYTSIEPQDEPQETTESSADNQPASEQEGEEGKPFNQEGRVKELDAIKTELTNEYKALSEENTRLAEMKKKIKTTDDVKKYNAAAKKLIEKQKEHERKRKAYFSAVEEYNAKVDSQNKEDKNQ